MNDDKRRSRASEGGEKGAVMGVVVRRGRLGQVCGESGETRSAHLRARAERDLFRALWR